MKTKKNLNKEEIHQKLHECVNVSEKHGLSKMTMEEITNEVRAVRKTKRINSKK
jgi:hypothetical protein